MNTQKLAQIENMKTQTIGCEVEMYNIERKTAAKVAADFFGTGQYFHGGAANCYDCYTAVDGQSREWKFMRDSSISASTHGTSCEMVTPILQYEDLDMLEELIRQLRHANALSDPAHKCGIHIHIGAGEQTPQSIRMLCNMMASHEDVLEQAIAIDPARAFYCRKMNEAFVKMMDARRPETLDDVADIWYTINAPGSSRTYHYNESRYHMLNLHALFTKGTIEFRMFQFDNPTDERKGGLHAGQLKGYIQFCLAICAQAKAAKRVSTSARVQNAEHPRKAMRRWLRSLGLRGDEFKTCRLHLQLGSTGSPNKAPGRKPEGTRRYRRRSQEEGAPKGLGRIGQNFSGPT